MKTRSGMDFKAAILYEDNHLLVINKPAGIAVQKGRPDQFEIIEIARHFLEIKYAKPGRAWIGMVHRLDLRVSGVLILAKTSKAASRLSIQFRERSLKKNYLAVVEGVPRQKEAMLTDYLEKTGRQMVAVSENTPLAKWARLHYRVLFREGNWSCLQIELHTGVYHQIRCQLAALGFPILGDRKYGAEPFRRYGGIGLHCHNIEVEHPIRGVPMSFTAPLPDAWPQAIKKRIDDGRFRC